MKQYFLSLLLLASLLLPFSVLAQGDKQPVPILPTGGASDQVPQTLTIKGLQAQLVQLTVMMIRILTILSAVPLLYGAFLWVTSRGETDRIAKGKKTFFWGAVGLVLGLSATVVMSFLLSAVSGVGGGG